MKNQDSRSRQVYELFIRTTPNELWRALTDGRVTQQYFFGTVVKSSYEAGAPIEYVSTEGAPMVSGTVKACEPEKKLEHTWKVQYDPTLSDEVSRVTWLIEKRGNVCKLTAIHDLEAAPKTAAHVGEGSDGWSVVLSGLKTYLETGKPLELPMSA